MKLTRWRARLSTARATASNGKTRDGNAADREIYRRVMGAEIESLYGGGYPTAAGGFIVGVLLWTFFYLRSDDPAVLVWAALLHLAPAARLGVLIAFQRSANAH